MRLMLVALLMMFATPSSSGAQTVTTTNCERYHVNTSDFAPVDRGPLRLVAIHCQVRAAGSSSVGRASVSPDARSIFYVTGIGNVLRVSRLTDENVWTDHAVNLSTFMSFAHGRTSETDAIEWSADSRSILAATQTRMQRGGWALTPLTPVRFTEGAQAPLGALRHEAGSLDGLMWVGGNGLALALFGTRGSYYRPEHPNPSPTIAIVDARRGRVLQALAARTLFPTVVWQNGESLSQIRNIPSVLLRDGRMRSIFGTWDWIVWTQGERPQSIPNPFPNWRRVNLSFAPDGRTVLIYANLTATGLICEHTDTCPTPTPSEGVWAAVYDLEARRVVWTMEARVTAIMGAVPDPEISPDGRHALVVAPFDEHLRPSLLLVSMRDGRILQRIPVRGTSYYNSGFGFARGGAVVWVNMSNATALYSVR